ncbi:MAG: tetratricopeptide repeat protein [Anaerolineales bacterium]|nr:tetratricopeptide repeat protein [Anaerolineales bacterium]
MAKVSLRIYNREIEGLIEQGKTEEAVAHCHHILKTFPKHLETYRLLGKSYLEAKRYNDAIDIFGRVLMSVPGDFVAHVGMSIIRDEENKLDDSIWHMERAFEAQSANAAIQGELQRLYGRRDGMEPPKIRMTRGALAHMYVQGELYPQSIAEIRSVLSEDPQRGDMQVLLALSYFRSGQKSDASDMCGQLLKRYPYCFDANRIMVELLPSTAGAAESTQVYRMRVGELDPYATFVKGPVFESNEVADAAINLDRLEYTGDEVPMGQEWGSSLGIGLEASSAPALGSGSLTDQPDWLKSDSSSSFQAMPVIDPVADSNDGIPDFLRAAGWGESNSPEQPTSFFDEEPSAGDLTPADLPDWLKGQVPSSVNPPTKPLPDQMQPIATPDWLSGLGESQDSESESVPTGNTSDWLSGLSSSETSQSPELEPEPLQEANLPDWLGGLDSSQTSETEPLQENNIPDWLGGMDDVSKDQPSQISQPAPTVESLGSTAQEQDDAVAWLESLAAKHGAKPEELVTDPSKRFETPPEWVSQAQNLNQQALAPQTPAPTVESLGSTAQEQDDAVAWLESLATKHGAKPEELVTDPSKRFETPPEWVSQAQNLNQQAPVPQATSPQTPAPTVESLGSTAQEQDDAVAWLESLAAKHGAKPEELVTDPSKRFEKPPEWVSQAQSIGEAQAASNAMEETPVSDQQANPVENAMNIGEQFFAEFETASTAAPANDETEMWLRGLDEKDKQDESSEQSANNLPDWLSDAPTPASSVDQPEITEQQSDAQKSDLPNWLSGIEEGSPSQGEYVSQNLSNDDLSNWLSGLDDEPGLPFDALPTPDSILTTPKSETPVVVNSSLPDWLSDVDSKEESEEDLWKESVGQESASVPTDELFDQAPPAETSQEKPASVSEANDLPDWLKGVDEKPDVAVPADDEQDTPPWQHREQWESEVPPEQPKPTSPSDWHPAVEVEQESPAPVAKPKVVVTEQKQAVAQTPIEQPAAKPAAPAKKKAGLPAKQRQPEAQSVTVALNQAKGELDRGDIPTALEHYGKLIKKGKHLEETIRDLTESIYRYPVEVGIWQTLGDAYMRANRLKEALEAYNKAEELIR